MKIVNEIAEFTLSKANVFALAMTIAGTSVAEPDTSSKKYVEEIEIGKKKLHELKQKIDEITKEKVSAERKEKSLLGELDKIERNIEKLRSEVRRLRNDIISTTKA